MTMGGAYANLGTFRTDRLLIRPVRPADAEAVFVFKSDPQVTGPYGQEPHRTVEESRAWVEKRIKDYAAKDSVFWSIVHRDDDKVIGECCLWNFDAGFRCAEIGYELNSSYWNQGLMTESLTEVLGYGLDEMGLHRIEACPYKGNMQSQALLVKLGFRKEGELRQRHFFRGAYLDQLYFGLLVKDWKERTIG
jgi:[ribosomal protein S5]-alanine N-acetyltransferase